MHSSSIRSPQKGELVRSEQKKCSIMRIKYDYVYPERNRIMFVWESDIALDECRRVVNLYLSVQNGDINEWEIGNE